MIYTSVPHVKIGFLTNLTLNQLASHRDEVSTLQFFSDVLSRLAADLDFVELCRLVLFVALEVEILTVANRELSNLIRLAEGFQGHRVFTFLAGDGA